MTSREADGDAVACCWESPDGDAEAEAESEGDADGWVQPGTGVTGAATLLPPYAGPEPEPEPEKVPVLAASATPPDAPTASTEARTLMVSILASGDLIICSLRKFATDARWFASNAATAICSPASSSSWPGAAAAASTLTSWSGPDLGALATSGRAVE